MAGPIGTTQARVALVHDEAYFVEAVQLIRRAKRLCRCALFIVDPAPYEPGAERVDALLRELEAAVWRGVDTRLLVAGSRTNRSILDAALAARRHAQELGVPVRLGAANPPPEGQGSEHSKFVVADDRVLLGSHNWSPGALSGQIQDSVLVEDAGVAAYLVERFERLWPLAEETGYDVQG